MRDIQIAIIQAELQAIFQLRYQVSVEELGADMKYADHSSQELCEPRDATSEERDQFQSIKRF